MHGAASGSGATAGGPPGERWVAVCEDLTGPEAVKLRHWPRQSLGGGELRLRIHACGVNFPDVLMTRGQYQLRVSPPFVPGMEAAGVVEELGPGTPGFARGDRVVVTLHHGLFTSEAVVPASHVTPAPPAFSMSECACYYVGAFTAFHALVDRAQVRAGETVLVLGAGGGTGLAAVEVAKLLGARVIAAASSPGKLEAARSRGAAHTVDYAAGPLVDQVRAIAPEGVDLVFDPVGGELFEQALRLPAWNGRVLVIGFASGRIGTARANLPLIKGYSIIGVRAGEATRREPALALRATRRIAAWTAGGALRPLISHSLPLAEAASALRSLENRTALGRIVLLPPDSTAWPGSGHEERQ
jgi:NADPH2:quinone reductase